MSFGQRDYDRTKPEVDFPGDNLPDDLVIQDIIEGTGREAQAGDTVSAHYVGVAFSTGEEFDSSFGGEPVEFPLGAVVAGFSEAITHMRPGDEVIATFPGSLGYGPEGRGPIPPEARH